MGKDICKSYIQHSVNIQNIKNSYNSTTTTKTRLKNGQRNEQIFFQRHTDGQQTHKKMFNITNYQGNANQTHNEISSHTHECAIIKKARNSKCWRVCGEKGTLIQCWQECNQCSHNGKQYGQPSKKLRIELPYDSPIPLLGIYPKNTKTVV